MTLFAVLALLMTLLALGFVLPTLLRGGGDDAQRRLLTQARSAGLLTDAEYTTKLATLPAQASRGAPRVAWALAFLLPLLTMVGYRLLGNPAGMSEAAAPANPPTEATRSMEQAIAGLAERLQQQPDDKAGWLLLIRAHAAMERYDDAVAALDKAIGRWPDDPDLLVQRASLLILRDPQQQVSVEAGQLADRVLALAPDKPQAHWIKGMLAFQHGDYLEAASRWEPLLDGMEQGEGREMFVRQINEARQGAGLPPLPATEASAEAAASAQVSAPSAAAPAGDGPRLRLRVEISPELQARLQPSDVLFVSARASNGPPIPLAAKRFSPVQLPLELELSDADAMTAQFRLSTASEVVLSARISHAGIANAAPGDFEALPQTVASRRSEPLTLRIERLRE